MDGGEEEVGRDSSVVRPEFIDERIRKVMSFTKALGAELGPPWGEVTQDFISSLPDRASLWAALAVCNLKRGVFYKSQKYQMKLVAL